MCAGSDTKIRESCVSVYMGYYGGSISIGDKFLYSTDHNDSKSLTRDRAFKELNLYKKTELINLILDIIDNAEEG